MPAATIETCRETVRIADADGAAERAAAFSRQDDWRTFICDRSRSEADPYMTAWRQRRPL
jgi:hypothetical protein